MPENPNPNGPTPNGPTPEDPAKGAPTPAPASGDQGDQADALAAAEQRATEAEAEAARLRRSNAAQKGTDVAALRSELQAEIRSEFAAELLRAEVRAAAAGRLADPSDALALLDLSTLAGQNGKADPAAVTAALDKLVKDKPYLAATPPQGAAPWGDVGAGQRRAAEPEPSSPFDRLRRAYSK
ncbi:hypothetical protein [Kitasatospora sp. NPDC002040]|uniref:hypothetical protein n=1 Tax=Kitasatospora sp. NPDC002040 TaxID=3154661 RepID=UPI00331C5A90